MTKTKTNSREVERLHAPNENFMKLCHFPAGSPEFDAKIILTENVISILSRNE